MTGSNFSRIYAHFGIQRRWAEMGWEEVEGMEEVIEKIRPYLEDKQERGLLLRGGNGTGKTMLLNLFFKEFLRNGVEAYVVYFPRLVEMYKESWSGKEMFKRVIKAEVLGIDDLGKGFMVEGGASKELVVACLDYVLRSRYERKVKTWATTNLKMTELGGVFTSSIASLAKRCFDVISIEGLDFGDKQYKILR